MAFSDRVRTLRFQPQSGIQIIVSIVLTEETHFWIPQSRSPEQTECGIWTPFMIPKIEIALRFQSNSEKGLPTDSESRSLDRSRRGV